VHIEQVLEKEMSKNEDKGVKRRIKE